MLKNYNLFICIIFNKATLKTAYFMVFPSSFTSIYNFITSPQAGAPTKLILWFFNKNNNIDYNLPNPVPTFFLFLSKDPTFLGFS
jgi:hypothetical protein